MRHRLILWFFSMFFLFIHSAGQENGYKDSKKGWMSCWNSLNSLHKTIDYKHIFCMPANIGPHSARNVITHYFRQPNCFSKNNNNNFSRWNVHMWSRCQIIWTKNHYISNPSTFIVCLFDIGSVCSCILAFPTGPDSATFRDKGTKIPSLSWDKGTAGQAQNLATGQDGTGFWQPVPSRPGTSRGTEMKEKVLKRWDFFLWFPVFEHLFLF